MRKLSLALLTVVIMGLAMPMAAELCTIDPVPAATLLLPYFEVDVDNTNGVNTLFSVNNASATAVLAHVTIWSDLSVPVLDFDIYLTGFDVQTVSLGNIIRDGALPVTASAGQDPKDTISPHGDISQDINFASCNPSLPPPASIGPAYIAHLQAALTGVGSTLETGSPRCYGLNHGDRIARGYITIDTVNACSLYFPSDEAFYWGAGVGAGFATNQNVLWGDFFFVDSANNFAQGDTLVHIESAAGSSFAGEANTLFLAGDHTFYGRYIATNAYDQRESLPSVYAVRYLSGGEFDGGTDVTVWRDSNTDTASAFSCTSRPSWYPLQTSQIVVFDEEENPVVQAECPVSPCVEETVTIPAETQRVEIGIDIPTEEDFGWLYLNLNHVPTGTPVYQDGLAQAWVGANMDASGRFSVGFQGISLNQLCGVTGDPNIVLPVN